MVGNNFSSVKMYFAEYVEMLKSEGYTKVIYNYGSSVTNRKVKLSNTVTGKNIIMYKLRNTVIIAKECDNNEWELVSSNTDFNTLVIPNLQDIFVPSIHRGNLMFAKISDGDGTEYIRIIDTECLAYIDDNKYVYNSGSLFDIYYLDAESEKYFVLTKFGDDSTKVIYDIETNKIAFEAEDINILYKNIFIVKDNGKYNIVNIRKERIFNTDEYDFDSEVQFSYNGQNGQEYGNIAKFSSNEPKIIKGSNGKFVIIQFFENQPVNDIVRFMKKVKDEGSMNVKTLEMICLDTKTGKLFERNA